MTVTEYIQSKIEQARHRRDTLEAELRGIPAGTRACHRAGLNAGIQRERAFVRNLERDLTLIERGDLTVGPELVNA